MVIYRAACVVFVVVVDSHIQRIVLATEETTVTQQVSHRPIKCQSRLWSQRGTKVNGSHHGDNPLLRPTGIQIATKSYAALQAMAYLMLVWLQSSQIRGFRPARVNLAALGVRVVGEVSQCLVP